MSLQKVILFVPHGDYAFRQQLATAHYLASKGEYVPYFLLLADYDYRFIDQLGAAGVRYLTMHPVKEIAGETVDEKWSDDQETPSLGSTGAFKGLSWYRRLKREKRTAKGLVRPLSPICAIVSQERPHLFLPVLKALKELKVPMILMPAADSSPDGCAWPRRSNYSLKAGLNDNSESSESDRHSPFVAILNKFVRSWLPSQVHHSPWGNMLFYPSTQIVLLKAMGMLPRNPWYQGTTFPDHIMISGPDEAAMYAEAQIDSGSLLQFGSHELDVLHERWLNRAEIRQGLIESYRLDGDKKILMVSLPRMLEHGLSSEEDHWRCITKILDALSLQDCNVVISLHPSCDQSKYAWIEGNYPFKFCKESLAGVLAAADIFVASYSSTNRWAIALGIPVINLDLWDFNWDMYRNLGGTETVKSIQELGEALTGLAVVAQIDTPNDSTMANNHSKTIVADGNAKARLLSFIRSLDGAGTSSAVISRHTKQVG